MRNKLKFGLVALAAASAVSASTTDSATAAWLADASACWDRVGEIARISRTPSHHANSQATNESSLANDLGADSLDTAEIAMAINEAFGYDPNEQEMSTIKTVKDVVSILMIGLTK